MWLTLPLNLIQGCIGGLCRQRRDGVGHTLQCVRQRSLNCCICSAPSRIQKDLHFARTKKHQQIVGFQLLLFFRLFQLWQAKPGFLSCLGLGAGLPWLSSCLAVTAADAFRPWAGSFLACFAWLCSA